MLKLCWITVVPVTSVHATRFTTTRLWVQIVSKALKVIRQLAKTFDKYPGICRITNFLFFLSLALFRHFQSRLYSKSLLFRSGRTGLKIAPLLKLGSLETQTHPLEHSLTHFDYLSLPPYIIHSDNSLSLSPLQQTFSLSLSNIHPPWSSLDKGESLACTHNHVASFSLSNTHTYSHPPSHSHILSISLLQILPTPWSS